MANLQVRLCLQNEVGKNNKVWTSVRSIRLPGEDTSYVFPVTHQNEAYHVELFKLATVKSASKSMTKAGQYRNITVTLPPDVAALYTDSDGNFVFQDFYLEETCQDVTKKSVNTEELQKKIQRLELQVLNKDLSYSEIERKFVLDKFTGKNQNAKGWLQEFEKECVRYQICDDEKKILCLRLFLNDGAKDWFTSAKLKLDVDDWSQWSSSFLQTFADKGWTNVRYAYAYKYISGYGSLLEYALKKERLLLECEKEMTEVSRISHIVVGLPVQVQDMIDKEEIKTTVQLMNHLRKHESFTANTIRKADQKNNSLSGRKVYENKERRPCHICATLGKIGRFHPPDICRNKYRSERNQKAVNLTEEDEDGFNIEFEQSKN